MPQSHLAAVQAADVVPVITGPVLDGPPRFANLYRLLDLERSAIEEMQRISMPAAFEVLAAFESDEWREDKQAEYEAEIAEKNLQPQWSPTSKQSFYRWLQARAANDGHPFRTWQMLDNLKNAAECVRIVKSSPTTNALVALPATEDAWHPAYKLLNHGFRSQIAAVVVRAAEIAEGEGKPITKGIMSAARTEIWKTDPEIRTWVEQPGQTVDPRSKHDRAVTLYHAAKAAADALKKGDDGEMWRKFYDYIWELGT